jgi:hypothetical protein
MGIFKLAVVVAVGVSLLPADREKQAQLYERAAAAATWTLTFCERNTDTCSKAQTVWADFSKKAEFGAKLAYDVIRDNGQNADIFGRNPAPASFEHPETERFENHRSDSIRSGTLTPHDMKPAWRGKTANKDGI